MSMDKLAKEYHRIREICRIIAERE